MSQRNRKVWYSFPAKKDLEEISTDLLERASQTVSEDMAMKITLACAELSHQALLRRERAEFLPGIRLRLVLPYVIFYRVSGKEVEIVRILHGRRDLKSVFRKERDGI
ncbi:type II toxin-antitoxin system RelE/ParE family toxin [Candidatus Kaiserbacteria bacterium]|nr:type II toxin-antitoxin system RelE/ParE family toxin [Candidatus Kaiserbacteria bacterium]